jgi:hypothetical protein
MSNQLTTKNRSNSALGGFYSVNQECTSHTSRLHPKRKIHNALDISSPFRDVCSPIKRMSKYGSDKVIDESLPLFVSAFPSHYVPGEKISEIPLRLVIARSSHSLKAQIIKNISEVGIDEYFSCPPSIRAQKRKEYTAYIKSTRDVFKVLELGNTRNIVDAYDGAVDILAECDKDIITKAFFIALEKYVSENRLETSLSWEKNWEIFIKALSCGLKIKPYEKMSLLLSLCDSRYKLSRLIKLTLIDAIFDLDIDADLAKVMLQIFMSERESDTIVRQYAEQQAAECLYLYI